MSASTTYRPKHIPTIWLLAVLIVALAVMAIEMGFSNLQRTDPQPVQVKSQQAPLHATMSGDFLWLVSV